MKIFKYSINITDRQIINVSAVSKILSVVNQQNNIVMYVEEDEEIVNRIIIDVQVVGTGNVIDFDVNVYDFIGTVPMYDCMYMWHVYARKAGNIK